MYCRQLCERQAIHKWQFLSSPQDGGALHPFPPNECRNPTFPHQHLSSPRTDARNEEQKQTSSTATHYNQTSQSRDQHGRPHACHKMAEQRVTRTDLNRSATHIQKQLFNWAKHLKSNSEKEKNELREGHTYTLCIYIFICMYFYKKTIHRKDLGKERQFAKRKRQQLRLKVLNLRSSLSSALARRPR